MDLLLFRRRNGRGLQSRKGSAEALIWEVCIDYCGGLHNVNEAYTYLEDMGYRFSEPDTAIPVQRSDELFGGTGNYRDWLSGNYAVYNDGTLTTDFIYEECGSESGGLIAAKMDGKWGYITVDGTVIIPFEYDPSWQLYDGMGHEGMLLCGFGRLYSHL